MQNMNWVDYIILAIFIFSILAGLSRGFVKEVISLLTLIAAFIVAATFASTLAASFTGSQAVQTVVSQASSATGYNAAQPVSYAAIGLSFGLIFAATLIIGSLVGSALNLIFQTGILGVGNALLGGLFGLCRGFLINLVLIFLVQLTSFGSSTSWTQSQFVISFQPAVQWLGSIVSPSLANLKAKASGALQNVNSSIQNLTR